MASETVTRPKAFRKRHGLKKVFSVPVRKLRSNIVCPRRNGSSSRSGSRSVSHHKFLSRNNRDLARALSSEKEKFRAMVTENVSLKALLHDKRLELHGLEKQLCDSRQTLTVYQNSMRSHLKDAVGHSVALTESLKLAMGMCYMDSKDIRLSRNVTSGIAIPSSSSQPQRLRVNPMVGGLTIRHPTISLRRVVMRNENRVAERNVAPSEEEEEVSENIDDVSQSLEETQQRPGGLSTCLEEDEDYVADSPNESDGEEEESEKDDSIRRKVVSFCNVLEKDKNRSGLEAEKSISLNETLTHQSVESSCAELSPTQNCKIPNDKKLPHLVDKPCVLGSFSKRNPVVALNDISKFLKNSNSVNVQKVISDIDNSKLGDKSGALEGSSNEKENCPKSVTVEKSVSKQPRVSNRIDSNRLKGTIEPCMEGTLETKHLPDYGTRNTVRNNTVVKDISVPHVDEDPLEGTSWMHLHLFADEKKRTRKGDSRKCYKETHPKALDSKKFKGSNTKIVNTSKEKISESSFILQPQEASEIVADCMEATNHEYDVSDFDIGLQNCPIAQSTPMNHGKPIHSDSVSCASDVSKSSSKSSRDSHIGNTLVSSGYSSSQGNNNIKEGEKSMVTPLIDTKLDGKAFVTVRVKRLELPDLPSSNTVVITPPKVDYCAVMSDEEVGFLGFGVNGEAEENVMVIKSLIAGGTELTSRDACGSSITGGTTSMWSASVTQSLSCVSRISCDSSAAESGRPRRRAAPKGLKEPTLKKKLRQ